LLLSETLGIQHTSFLIFNHPLFTITNMASFPLVALAIASGVGAQLPPSAQPNFMFNMTLPIASGLFGSWRGQMNNVETNRSSPNFGLNPGWNVTFSDSPWSRYQPGMLGLGDSEYFIEYNDWHAMDPEAPPMIMSLLWGSAVYVHGSWQPRGDDAPTAPSDGLGLYVFDSESTSYPFTVQPNLTSSPSYAQDGIIMSVDNVPMQLYRWGFGGSRNAAGGSITISSVTLTTGITVNHTDP
jgi:hypothetical protein